MSETEDGGTRQKPGAGGAKTLSLKRTETSTVRQSFSHGRSKAVVVEKKRARVTPTGKPLEIEKHTKLGSDEAAYDGRAVEMAEDRQRRVRIDAIAVPDHVGRQLASVRIRRAIVLRERVEIVLLHVRVMHPLQQPQVAASERRR